MSDFYLSVKVLHILGLVLWLGGQVAIVVRAIGSPPAQDTWSAGDLEVVRRVMNPAMFLAIGAGIVLAMTLGRAHWEQAGWLHLKLAVVLSLVATHGWSIRELRRASRMGTGRSRFSLLASVTIVLGAIAVYLAVAKPAWTS